MIDSNNNRVVSPTELELASEELNQFFAAGVKVYASNKLKIADSIKLTIEEDDNLLVSLTYYESDINSVNLSMPLLSQLPRGHRHYLQINGHDVSTQHVLSARSNSVSIDLNNNSSMNETNQKFNAYFSQGLVHIFWGLDHILFLLTLILPALFASEHLRNSSGKNLKYTLLDIIKIITAFSIAHSITLGLALFQIVQLPGKLVEVAIAFSIVICAVHNLRPILPISRWVLAFGFGLIHGFGFAGALTSLGMESQETLLPLLAFNLGIEVGQIVIVIVVVPLLFLIRHTSYFVHWIYKGGSMAAIVIASVWMIERLI